jgi:hypothetical protein
MKNLVTLPVAPPATSDRAASNGLGKARHWPPGCLEHHSVKLNERQSFLPVHINPRRRRPSQNPVLLEKIGHHLPVVDEGCPDRRAPGMDRRVAFRAFTSGNNFKSSHRAPLLGEEDRRPGTPLSPELHMHPLDLPAGEVLLDEEIQAHEGEYHSDRPTLLVRMLSGEGVDHVLVDELGITAAECVAAQGIVSILLRVHSTSTTVDCSPPTAAERSASGAAGERPTRLFSTAGPPAVA